MVPRPSLQLPLLCTVLTWFVRGEWGLTVPGGASCVVSMLQSVVGCRLCVSHSRMLLLSSSRQSWCYLLLFSSCDVIPQQLLPDICIKQGVCWQSLGFPVLRISCTRMAGVLLGLVPSWATGESL